MFSNTENSSASDKVNTRPRLKAYFNFIKANEQKLALAAGYLLVAALFFGLGKYWAKNDPPDIRIEEQPLDLSKLNNNLNTAISQSGFADTGVVAGETVAGDCAGKIKGNISSNSKIYHMPGGAFYKRTVPEMCFDTEAAAREAGFRKSQR